jgi:transcriptional regulator GlxA family with amidase domain
LTTTTDPLKTVARAVGFSSPTHLAALIRRATGRRAGSFRHHRGQPTGSECG